jgi:hypothetical protein
MCGVIRKKVMYSVCCYVCESVSGTWEYKRIEQFRNFLTYHMGWKIIDGGWMCYQCVVEKENDE